MEDYTAILLSASPLISSLFNTVTSDSSVGVVRKRFSSTSSGCSLGFSSSPPACLLVVSNPFVTVG